MLGNLNGWHLVIILFLVLLLFGAPKLPGLARSVGQSMKIFKSEIRNKDDDDVSSTDEGPSRTEAQPSTDDAQKTPPRSDAAAPSDKPSDDPTSRS